MATTPPDRPHDDDPPHDPPLLSPVEPLDTFDDGLILTDDGARPPAGVPTPADDPAEAEHVARELGEIPTADPVDPADVLGGPTTPAKPASGWLGSGTRLPAPSDADIDLPPVRKAGEEPSDIFSTARKGGGSDLFGASTGNTGGSDILTAEPSWGGPDGSDLSVGADPGSRGSSVFDHPSSHVPDPIDLDDAGPGGRTGEGSGRGSGRQQGAADVDEEFIATDPNLVLPEDDDDGSNLSGFNRVDKEQSGSDLFGDATVVDVNLLSDGGASGINLLHPDAHSDEDAESVSSIFSSPDLSQASDGGRVDLDAIPLLGPGDGERTDSMFPPAAADPSAGLFRGDDPEQKSSVSFEMGDGRGSQDALVDYQDSGNIAWDEDAPPDDRTQASLARKLDDAIDEDESTSADLDLDAMEGLDDEPAKKPKKSLDEESVFSMPVPAAVNEHGLSAVLGAAAAAAAAPTEVAAPRPTAAKKVTLATTPGPAAKKRPAGEGPPPPTTPSARRPAPEKKSGGGLLLGAAGLVVGAGLGAVGMYVGGILFDQPKEMSKPGIATLPPAPPPAVPDPAVAEALKAAEKKVEGLTAQLGEAKTELDRQKAAGPGAIATAVKEARDRADKLLADLTAAKRDLAAKTKDAETATAAATAANKELADKTKAAETATAAATAATKELADKTKAADAAKADLTAAETKLKAADAAVDTVLAKLKDAKLIDPAADRAAAVAALPEAVKKAVVVTGKDAVVEELTAAAAEAKKARDAAEAKAKAAEAALTVAKADAAKKVEALEVAAKGFDQKMAAAVKTATEAAKAEAAESLRAAQLERDKGAVERAAEVKRFEEKLAAQAEAFRQQLAAARSGAVVPLADVERAAIDRAKRSYASGLEAYAVGSYATAEGWFARAAKEDPSDARFWYYLGLSKWSQGKAKEADADFQTGAEWEGRGKPGRRAVGEALLKVQGAARSAVDAHRP